MSKREKLEKQMKKQLEQKRLAEIEEKKSKEEARNKSTATTKPSKKTIVKPREKGGYIFAKIVMTLIALYSCVFYSAVTIIAILHPKLGVNGCSSKDALILGIGSALIIAGVVISYFRKYYASLLLNLVGTITYMKFVMKILDQAKDKLKNYDGADPTTAKMDKTLMIRHYPILIILIISFILALVTFIKYLKKKKKIKEQKDNAPVKSIIG